MPITHDIIVHFEDGEIIGVDCRESNGTIIRGETFSLDDRKKLKKSLYGLRKVNTLYEYNKKYETLANTADLGILAGSCYQIIGGFKVKVPCP
jgi:hypothetical protein